MRSTSFLALPLALGFAASCGGAGAPADRVSAEKMPAREMEGAMGFAGPPPAPALPASHYSEARAQVLDGTVRLRVGVVDSAVAQITELAARFGGHLGTRVLRYGEERARSGTIQMRVPSDRFDSAMAALADVGRLEHSAVNATEVGDQLIDLRARLANAKRLEGRLLDVLRSSTGKLTDVLAVERELARVREEIERLDAHLRALTDRVAMSTINVDLFEPAPVLAFSPAAATLRESYRQAWRNFVELLAGLIAASGILLPIAVVAVSAWMLVRGMRRRGARGRTPPPATAGGATAAGVPGS